MDFRGLRPKEVAVPRENTGRALCSIAGRGNGISLDLGWEDRPPRIIAHWYTDRSEEERKRGERDEARGLEGRRETRRGGSLINEEAKQLAPTC